MGDEWEGEEVQNTSQSSASGLTAVVRMYCHYIYCLYFESVTCL